MTSLVPVSNHPRLLRDKNSKALINTDIAALKEYKNRKKMAEDVDILKNEVRELKHLILLLINK
jgi:hypothetical protein